LKPNSNTKYRSDALTRKMLLWFSQYTQAILTVTYSATGLKTSRLITPLKPRQQSRAGFPNRLCRLKPRTSRSKGFSSNLWSPQSQLPVYNQFDKCSSKFCINHSFNSVLYT